MSDLRFDDRVVLVTGAGRGMGRAHALLLAGRGAKVVVSDVGTDLFGSGSDPGPASEVVATIRAADGEAVAYFGDLATEEGARGAVRSTLDAFGRLDALIHNAGFTLGGMPFERESLDRLERQLAINTRAAYALVQEAWTVMQTQRYGRIVMVASTAIYGLPMSIPYSTAKASYIGFVRGLASEGTSHGILVNAIAPAGATRMAQNLAESEFRTWFLETMRPELVSPLVAFLGHEDCTVTGELLVAGGGRVARTVLAETRGYINPRLSPEDVRDHFDDVMADREFCFPRDTIEAGRFTAGFLGHELRQPVALAATDVSRDIKANRS